MWRVKGGKYDWLVLLKDEEWERESYLEKEEGMWREANQSL